MNSSSRFFGAIFLCGALICGLSLVPSHSALAEDAEGIMIQRDVYLNSAIQTIQDLPDELTVSLYDSQTGLTPLATQIFPRGAYTLDFDLSKSDGVELGPIARLKVYFTNKLNLGNDPNNPTRVTEIWSEASVNDQPIVGRLKVSDETLVRLLLASDASLATYVTFAYKGDTNPLTTIYQSLPLASSLSAKEYVSSLFSAVSTVGGTVTSGEGSLTSPYWEPSGTDIFYNNGNVGIGTASPVSKLDVRGGIFAIQATGGNVLVGEGLGENEYGGYVWDAVSNTLRFATASANSISFGHYNGTVERMRIASNGNVGISTANPAYTLAVNGSIGCKELTVTTTGWSDFVFQKDYPLPSLEEVEAFISENQHLPGIPAEKDVLSKGVNVGDISSKLLQKVEELTLYMIQLKKENEALKSQMAAFQEQIGK